MAGSGSQEDGGQRVWTNDRTPGRQPRDLTDEQLDALRVARYLVECGVPVFLAQRADSPTGGHNGCGYWLPKGWERAVPDVAVVDRWRPGTALCALMGGPVDGADVDPRSGGAETLSGLQAAGMWPRSYGRAETPSGGSHDLVAALGVGSRDGVRPGLDLKGGRPDGSGRGFLFIAPTVKRSKVDGRLRPYRWLVEPDLDELVVDGLADESGLALAGMVESSRAPALHGESRRSGNPHEGTIPAGERDATLLSYAWLLVNRYPGHTVRELEALMRLRWEDCEQPLGQPYPLEDALAKLRSALGKVPLVFAEEDTTEGEPRSCSLEDVHATFRRWLGSEYDLDALDVVLAAAAVEQLDGDPLWLLVVSGSGNAKTETVQALDGIGAVVTSTISSAGALLSATSKRERSEDATGGLLRKLEDRGVLVIKDVTSILSANRDARAELLAALREVYDGRWSRNVGTDGGRTLDWTGRLAFVGAVTTAWDKAHDVIASMGDRFVLVRVDSTTGRVEAGRRAIGNTGDETRMRAELAGAVRGLLTGLDCDGIVLDEAETERLLAAADLVTLARTGVEYDYRGDVIDAHAPEMPTRFAKQLAQVVRGCVAYGHDRRSALRLAIRCARDSMPPLRLAIVDDLATFPGSTSSDVRRRLGKPRATVDRQLQALHMLGVLVCAEEGAEFGGRTVTRWSYRLARNVDPSALDPDSFPDLLPPAHRDTEKDGSGAYLPPNISGKGVGS